MKRFVKPHGKFQRLKKKLHEKAQAAKPVCRYCGSSTWMILIKFLDKKTGELRVIWKCQPCAKWHNPK